ncbi:hypothetical protein [Neptuniibacter sp. CAU 1671]|uniref:alkaline phosphatase family protein n=1 Tax=Neptuniibacter sp. CAU 1671 TaxID=3032593 RepID=UPI0023DA03A5|nr:hypothetical protein [Neptuniibacter sp. CAU 1671]MDF2181408.1 hypothetical protein [Neptuniibacter sp. CAU 1671]
MKLLMIGMDGAHIEAFKRGWTPVIQSMIETQHQYKIKNDLLSRGWLEIATGQHAAITSAMYDKPSCRGTLDWSLEFKFSDSGVNSGKVVPLWHAVNKLGYKVGVMNLPTTFPAPEVSGFFVSGGGGGAPVTESATPELCYPQEIVSLLSEHGYIVDQRLYQLVVDKNKKNALDIFTQLQRKNHLRTQAFLELDKRFEVDFGFIVYKTAAVFAETFLHTEQVRIQNPENTKDQATLSALEAYYRAFDKEILALKQAYPDADFMFVSDHGTEIRKSTFNPNVLLEEAGLFFKSKKNSVLKKSVALLKRVVPFWLKAFLKKNVSKSAQSVGGFGFDVGRTKVFCKSFGDWRHGLYVNDMDRFGGPVKAEEKQALVCDVLELLKANDILRQHNISARAATERFSQPGTWFPDIVFDLPDGCLTNDQADRLLQEFRPTKSNTALQLIMRGDILSIKSHWPLFVTSIEPHRATPSESDLTAVYELVVKYFDTLDQESAHNEA